MQIRSSRLPSLDHLKGFVAVGRRMSITQAARDLHLTQSAVSRQVSSLEECLGTALFVRRHRSIAFTADGAKLFQVADAALTTLLEAISDFSCHQKRQPVTITASLGVTALWLLPRIGRLQEAFPHVDLCVSADNKLLDLRTKGVDIAIRYCECGDAPPGATRLFGEALAPVGHKSFADADLTSPAGLSRLILLEYEDHDHQFLRWGEWLNRRGLRDARPRAILRFNHYDQLIQGAIAGQGIALGRFPLIAPVLEEGRLMEIGSLPRCPLPNRQYCLAASQTPPTTVVAEIMKWLANEAAGPSSGPVSMKPSGAARRRAAFVLGCHALRHDEKDA